LLVLLFLFGLALLLFAQALAASATNTLTTPGLTREFPASVAEVRQAVQMVQRDQIIHGTLIFDKEPVLGGAEAVESSPLFEAWEGPGEVYYKIRKNAIAPRHFLESADQGTIAVRYVVIPVNDERTRVHVDAVYVESAHRRVHASDGNVEKSEMQEVKDQLEATMEAAQEAADAKRRQLSAELVHQTYARQREDESTQLSSARSMQKDLEQEINTLRHEVERRVKAPGTEMKAAPFRSAATLKTLDTKTEVVVLIISPHWLGVETPEGQRGWIPEDQLEPLP